MTLLTTRIINIAYKSLFIKLKHVYAMILLASQDDCILCTVIMHYILWLSYHHMAILNNKTIMHRYKWTIIEHNRSDLAWFCTTCWVMHHLFLSHSVILAVSVARIAHYAIFPLKKLAGSCGEVVCFRVYRVCFWYVTISFTLCLTGAKMVPSGAENRYQAFLNQLVNDQPLKIFCIFHTKQNHVLRRYTWMT